MKIHITACDRCGIREEKKTIKPWTARRGSTRYQGDLCEKCWTELLKTFQPSALSKNRHQIIVTNVEDIPKNS